MLFTVENVTVFLVGVFCVALVFFKWRYRYWLVRRVPFLEPKAPFGNTENPLTRDRSMIFIVKGLYDELRSKGYKHGGKTNNYNQSVNKRVLIRCFHNRATDLHTSGSRVRTEYNVKGLPVLHR